MTVKKKLIIFSSVIFGVFLIINIIWFAFVWRKYEGYKDKLGSEMVVDDMDELGKRFVLNEREYSVSIKTPMYPRLTGGGFLRVSKRGDFIGVSEDGTPYNKNGEPIDIKNTKIKPSMVFYVWPNLFSGYRLGIEYDNFESGEIEMYQLMLDNDLKPDIPEEEDDDYELKLKELYNENYDDMIELIKYANDLFDLELNVS